MVIGATTTNTYDSGDPGGGHTPDPDPDPKPTPDPDPEPTPDTEEVPDDPTPLEPMPEEPSTEVPEEDVPLVDAPKTGDNMIAWALAAAASGLGLVWMALRGRKRKEENV